MKGVKSVEFRFYILTLIILTTQGSTQRSFGAAKRNIVIKKNNELSLEVQSVQINSDLIKIGLNNKNFVTLNSPKPIRIICSKLSQNSVNTPGKISAFVNTQQAESLKCLEFHRDHLNEDAYCLKQEFRFNLPARGYSYYDVSCRIEGSEGAASVSTFLHRLYTDGIPRIRSSLSLDNLNSTVAHMINLERLSCESIKGSSKGEVALGFNALQWFIGGQGPSPGQDHSIGFNTISNQITEDLYIYKSPFPLHSKQITNNTIYKCCTILNGKIVECQQFLANIYSQPTKFTKSQKSSSTTISTSITSKSPPSSKFSTFSTQTTTKTTSKTTSAHKINSKSKNVPPLLNIPQAAPFRPAKLPSYLPNTNIHNSKSLTPIVKQKSNIITSIIIPSIKTPAVALTSTLTSSTLSYVSTKKISLPARPSTFKSSPSINHSPPSMNSILSSNSAPKSDSIKAKPNPSEPKLNNKEVKNSVKGGYIDSTQTEPGDNGLSDSLVGLIIACTAGTLILTLTLVLLLLCYKRHRYGNSQQEMKNENLKKPVKRSHHHHHHHHQSDQYSKKSSPRSAAAPFSELASHSDYYSRDAF